MPEENVTVAGTCCWSTSPRRPAKSAAFAGRSYSKRSSG